MMRTLGRRTWNLEVRAKWDSLDGVTAVPVWTAEAVHSEPQLRLHNSYPPTGKTLNRKHQKIAP
ncbi:MAG: hypothetical protein ACRC8S_03350 [Fimbriiglobus sp.]